MVTFLKKKRLINLINKNMSCNINTWKNKKIENLKIPIGEFYKHERKDFHPSQPTVTNFETMEVTIKNCGQGKMIGILKDGILQVTDFSGIESDGSNIFYNILKEALKKSTGFLQIRTIWEGDSEVYELISNNGIITENKIEI